MPLPRSELVIRLRGAVARHVLESTWLPTQKDVWHEEPELLAPYLVQYLERIVSISPRALFDEVKLVLAHGADLRCGDDDDG